MVYYRITLLRLHQSKNIKQDLLLCKNIIYPEWKQLWVSFLWSILVRKLGLTFRKNWNRLHLIDLAKNIKKSCYLARLPVDLRFICLSHSVILRWCHYFPPIYLYSYSPHPLCIGMLFPTVFVVVFPHILPDVDLTLFITSCKTSSIKIWFVLAAGLAENLTQVVFRQPFVIQHVRTRLLRCETWNFLFFIFFRHYIIN